MEELVLSRKFRILRKEKKMTLKQLAKELNISISYLSDIENSRRCPSIPTLLGICDKLGIIPAYFFTEDTSEESRVSESSMAERIAYVEKGAEILSELYDLDKLTVAQREQILNFIIFIKNKDV
jgi:transcriptional regulator with XRE-family HTH domain